MAGRGHIQRGAQFSAGANVGMIFMMAVEQEYDELNYAIRMFQNTVMRLRAGIQSVTASLTRPRWRVEMCLHADKVIAHAETYMGLVEFGVGLIEGGGTKEFVLRLNDEMHDGDMRINRLRDRFLTIGQAGATSAHEAFELGYLREGTAKSSSTAAINSPRPSAPQLSCPRPATPSRCSAKTSPSPARKASASCTSARTA